MRAISSLHSHYPQKTMRLYKINFFGCVKLTESHRKSDFNRKRKKYTGKKSFHPTYDFLKCDFISMERAPP